MSYTIPPNAPDAVVEAYVAFRRVANLYEDASDDLHDAREALSLARSLDVKAIVAATAAGEEPKDPQKHERKAQAEIDRLTTLRRGYAQAADEAGDALTRAIEQHKDEWAETLRKRSNELAEQYDAALAEARLMLAGFVPAQAGVSWVENFTASDAQRGRYSQFAGGRVRVSGRRAGVQELRSQYDPASLLTVAALATKQAAPEQKPLDPSLVDPKLVEQSDEAKEVAHV
jgi:hypothetical protein